MWLSVDITAGVDVVGCTIGIDIAGIDVVVS